MIFNGFPVILRFVFVKIRLFNTLSFFVKSVNSKNTSKMNELLLCKTTVNIGIYKTIKNMITFRCTTK